MPVASYSEQTITYNIRWRLADGTEKEGGPFTTRRRRGVGDFVNLPQGSDGSAQAGKGYIWRVTVLEDSETTLILECPHPEMVEEVESD